jgi:hypothetical protein
MLSEPLELFIGTSLLDFQNLFLLRIGFHSASRELVKLNDLELPVSI